MNTYVEKRVKPELKATKERSRRSWLKIQELADVLQDTPELEKMFMALLKDLGCACSEAIRTFPYRLSMTCTGVTLASASTLEKELGIANGGNKEAAKQIGEVIAKRALEKGIETVAFDRGGFLYHGRVKELADGAREAGLKF